VLRAWRSPGGDRGRRRDHTNTSANRGIELCWNSLQEGINIALAEAPKDMGNAWTMAPAFLLSAQKLDNLVKGMGALGRLHPPGCCQSSKKFEVGNDIQRTMQ